jgi:ABC-type transporter Mla subunit MlaD
MNDQVFRWIATAGVVLAAGAFVVLAVVAVAISRGLRQMQARIAGFLTSAEPAIARLESMIERATVLIDTATPQIEIAGAAFEKAGPLLERARVTLDKASANLERAAPLIEQAKTVLGNANLAIEENRPSVAEIIGQLADIARISREQVDRLGALLDDAGDRAHARLAQIDETVTGAVEQVGEMGGALKRAAMRPVREANGVAAGISAAVATFVKGRKYSPDMATQDEEMFI